MKTKNIQFGNNIYFEALPVLEKNHKKTRYERKIREKEAVQNLKKESFGLLKDEDIVTEKNTKLIEPLDIKTIYNTWNNDSGKYGGNSKNKKKTKKIIMKKSRKSRKSRK